MKVKFNKEIKGLTKGKEYEVIDIEKQLSHLIIIDDNDNKYRIHTVWERNDFEIVR